MLHVYHTFSYEFILNVRMKAYFYREAVRFHRPTKVCLRLALMIGTCTNYLQFREYNKIYLI